MRFWRSPIIPTFLAAAAVLLASVAATYFVGLGAARANRMISSERSVLQHLERLISTVTEAETGQRGYLLTGEDRYLGPYQQAFATIHEQEATLRQLSDAGALPSRDIDTVIRLVEKKLGELDETVRLRRTQGLSAAMTVVHVGTGIATMDKIRAAVGALWSEQQARLNEATRRADTLDTVRTETFVLTTIFNVAFLFWAYRRITAEVGTREAAILEAIRQKEYLSTTVASIGDGVIATDGQGRVTLLNGEAEKLTGWSQSEALGRPLSEVFSIINEHSRKPVENPVDKVLELGVVLGLANHTLLLSKNGTEIPIDDSAAPIREANGKLFGVILVFRNVSEQRKNAEIQARLAAIVNSSEDAIVSKDLNGTILTWNTGAERIFGYTANEVVGRSIMVIIPDERQSEEKMILEQIRQGKPIEHFDTMRKRKGGALIDISLSTSPIRNSEGVIIGASKIARDVTARKQAERVAREAVERFQLLADSLELQVNERTTELRDTVAELEAFSYSISHDLRAPLRTMQGFARVVLDDFGDKIGAEGRNYLQRIAAGADRMDQLIQDVLTFSSVARTELKLGPVDLDKLLRGVLESYPNLQATQAEIVIENKLPFVRGNEAALMQCLSNLLSNAVKFVQPGTRPSIRIRSEPLNGSVRVQIQDNGIGIPKEAHQHIFEIFQRLSHSYEGTGIGLAIVRKAVERMGGRVELESEPGKGSTFSIILRRAQPPS